MPKPVSTARLELITRKLEKQLDKLEKELSGIKVWRQKTQARKNISRTRRHLQKRKPK